MSNWSYRFEPNSTSIHDHYLIFTPRNFQSSLGAFEILSSQCSPSIGCKPQSLAASSLYCTSALSVVRGIHFRWPSLICLPTALCSVSSLGSWPQNETN
ncbi:hypothetical protein AVEN_156531-1, partial [Araneus ventricosus]